MSVVWIQSLALTVDVLDHSIFVDHKCGAMRHRKLFVQDSVFRCNFASEIAEERERDADLLGIGLVCELAIDAYAQNRGACLLEFGDISLIRLELLRSPSSES
jgi:hypothetical protein